MSVTGSLASARWRRLLPLAFVTYSFAYVDHYSLGAAGGLEHSLHITSGETGLLGGLFFIGCFIFQVPAASFAERRSVKTLMFWSLISWGVFAAAQGVISWFSLLLVDRFLLGVVEAAAIPAMLVFLTHWFSDSERGRADTFLILGNPVTLLWMSIVSGYIIAATSYRWMFVIERLPAIAWAFVFRALVADRPADASWLEPAERDAITSRLAEEQAGIPKVGGYREVFKSANVVILALQYALWSIGVYSSSGCPPSSRRARPVGSVRRGSSRRCLMRSLRCSCSWSPTLLIAAAGAGCSCGRSCSWEPGRSTPRTPSAGVTSGCPSCS